MDNINIKQIFILFILISALIIIMSQCSCFNCKCKFKRSNSIHSQQQNIEPSHLEIRDNHIVVIGNYVDNNSEDRDIIIIDSYIIE